MIQDFINNDAIRTLIPKPYWTVNVDGKKPLDVACLVNEKRIRGAASDQCLTTLSNLLSVVNGIPSQFVYNLNAERDGFVVLDIEKTCPEDIKQTLLKLPFVYGDISMSGKGLHLMFPCPELDEVTSSKIKMKEEHGYYEILIHHYVSFTHFTIAPQFTTENAPIQFQEIWNALRQTTCNTIKKQYETGIDDIELNHPEYQKLKQMTIQNFKSNFLKTPADYYNDMSRYEFAVIGKIRMCLVLMMDYLEATHHPIHLDEMEQIAAVYDIVRDILPHRTKHDEFRNGQPLLLYQTFNSFATSKKE